MDQSRFSVEHKDGQRRDTVPREPLEHSSAMVRLDSSLIQCGSSVYRTGITVVDWEYTKMQGEVDLGTGRGHFINQLEGA